MALAVERILNSDGSCNYQASMGISDIATSVTVSKLITGGSFTLLDTITVPAAGDTIDGDFDGDGIYKFTDGTTIILLSNDCALTACLAEIAEKVICEKVAACDVANFNSLVLLAQTYWGLLDEDYQGQFIFNTTTLAAALPVLSSIQSILDRISKYCESDDSSDCGCS